MKFQNLESPYRLLIVAFFAVFLASCSSGGTSTDDDDDDDTPIVGDINGDGIIDAADGDFNGDGFVEDIDLDYNGDGFVDINDDVNGDGLVDDFDFDVNGDGFIDADDDLNGDGMVNSSDASSINLGPCQGQSGSDPNSSNDEWDDNCFVSENAPYRDSSYSRGIQRILWCQGFAPVGQPEATFADGSFGPNTRAAVEAFQTANSLDVDGIVGPETWGALRDQLELISSDASSAVWGVNSVDCNGQSMFRQNLDAGGFGTSWELAESRGSSTFGVFSTGF